MNNLEKLSYLRGISTHYFSYSGERIPVKWEDRMQLLREVGDNPEDSVAVEASIYLIDAKPWLSWMQSVHIITAGRSDYIDVRVAPDDYDRKIGWTVVAENDDVFRGEFTPAELPEVGDYHVDQVRYSARRLELEALPPGYHQITLIEQERRQRSLLIVAPECCFKGEPAEKRVWGINCQLYTLRSDRNWGLGDFTDLQELIELAARAGVDLISLNPLHAPDTSEMNIASPYSPTDRRFLNPLYIDPEQEPEFADLVAQDHQLQSEFNSVLPGLREAELIDYEAVASLKYSIYHRMYQSFVTTQDAESSDRAISFNEFVQQQGEALVEFSLFESQHSGLQVDSAADPGFHQYLQWLAHQQLERCQQKALDAGMRIGLMRDLAVGAVRNGAEVQNNSGLYCDNATIGAPPDPLAEQGQNWDLPALNPVSLKNSNYRLFIELLRSNMTSCGGLRIDHILGLLRLWWCHPKIENGAYVYYPFEDLIAILCLESHRHSCLIVGEDMGTVPDELRIAMKSRAIYSNRLFYFEKGRDQAFANPSEHERDALLMVTNHDVPTLAGWWEGMDLRIRREIGLLDSEAQLSVSLELRNQNKISLLDWLKTQQLLPMSWCKNPINKEFDFDLCSAIILANAKSQSRMVLFQLDDLQLIRKPVNIPGTYKQFPNWRRKQELETTNIFGSSKIQQLMWLVQQERML